ncbi:MAG: outer membrane protein assembly factor YaeT precursor [Labilithrix sp.]|nr:outer membrane protein assembly factor YaeT precursor [Labilithrix sp.]
MRRRNGIAALFGVIVAAAPTGALAQRPTSKSFEYSPYERETIARALEATGLELDPAPEGKIVERIDTLRLEVLEDRDPIPEEVLGIKTRKLANSLHYVSRDYVIRRQMLMHEGEPYLQILADETARNMRGSMPLQVSIVIIVPVRGSTPDKVGLLVITKDIWSLRLSFDLAVTPGGVENLLIVPQETNLLGFHHTVSTRFQYQPETYTFGVGYKVPRFGQSWIGASTGASITINRRSGEAEGAAASLSVGQGLYSTRTDWAWGADASYAAGISRRYVNAQVATFDSISTPNIRDNIPTEYKSRSYGASVGVTRSFGWGFKNNFNVSLNASSSEVNLIDGDLVGRLPSAVADFQQRFVPVGETRVYPSFTWATFSNDYLRTLDITTLALQEDYRLGHDVSATVYPVRKELGSTRDLVGFSAHAGYSVPLGDGLAAASATWSVENQDGTLSDASISGGFTGVTPRLGVGRFVMSTSFVNRYRNYLRSRTTTGGDDRLRGYPSNFFFGKDAVFYNIEFRSTSVEILKCALGGVAFFDAGDAAQGFDMLHARQSVGFGVRALFPQVNRLVFRADLAFPLKRGPFPETGIPTPVDPVGFFFSFGQAFGP